MNSCDGGSHHHQTLTKQPVQLIDFPIQRLSCANLRKLICWLFFTRNTLGCCAIFGTHTNKAFFLHTAPAPMVVFCKC